MAQADRREEVGVGEQHLRLAQEDKAVVVEGEVKAGQDPALGLGVEVDQRVATDQQVEPGDGRVLDQVVAPEDDAAPEVVVEDVPPADQLEVALAQRVGDGLQLVGAVAGLPRLGQRLLVDVGGVDLELLAGSLQAQGLGEEHRQRVGLLAAARAGAPDADHLARFFIFHDLGDDLLGQIVPGRPVAKERGDVDQDGVEEVGELVGVDLQKVAVRREALDFHDVHPPADAPHQAGALVAGEVEAPVVLEVEK